MCVVVVCVRIAYARAHPQYFNRKIFQTFSFCAAVGTCVCVHWNENYIKIMCKYNNQVNMKRLFWQPGAVDSFHLFALSFCFFFLTLCHLQVNDYIYFCFAFQLTQLKKKVVNGERGCTEKSFGFSTSNVVGNKNFCNCSSGIRVLLSLTLWLYGLISLCFSRNIAAHTHTHWERERAGERKSDRVRPRRKKNRLSDVGLQ